MQYFSLLPTTDLFVTNNGQKSRLYVNRLGLRPQTATLVVKPLTPAGAPSLFGSVTLETATGEFVALRTLAAAVKASQNEYGAHFAGLAPNTDYRIRVVAPSQSWDTVWTTDRTGGSILELRNCAAQGMPADCVPVTHTPLTANTREYPVVW